MVISTKLPQRKRHRGLAKLVVVLGAAVLSIAVFAGIFAWFMSGPAAKPEVRLNAGLRLLKKGQPQEAMLVAASVNKDSLESPSDLSKHHLLFGAAALDEAEHAQLRQMVIKKAKESEAYLQKAIAIGFPRGYEGLGNYLIGKALYLLYRWDEAIKPLEAAVAEWPSGRSDCMERLVNIELGAAKPNIELLRKRLDQWEALAGLTDIELELAKIRRIEAEFAGGESELAIELAENFPAESLYADNAKYLIALIAFKRQKASKLGQEAEDLEKVLLNMQEVARSPHADSTTRRRSKYYCGIIQYSMNRIPLAMTTFSTLRQESPQTVESAAASIEEIQTLIDLGRYDDASRTIRQLTIQFGDVAWYQNHWIPLDQMRKRTNELGQALLKVKAFSEVVSFAENLPPFCERSDVLKLLAEGYRQQALAMSGDPLRDEPLMDIRQAASTDDSATHDGTRQQMFSKAGKSFKELAVIELRSSEYHDLVWSAIDCFQAAGELVESNLMIDNAMAYEPRERQPRSIIKMAENYFALQELKKSLIQLERCINQFPNHPLAYQARLNAARILSEQSEFDKAVEYLEENLYISELTPRSPVWRESLFELGKLYFQRGEAQHAEAEGLKDELATAQKTKRIENFEASNAQFLKSIERLEEWIKRYPEDSRRFDTLYTIGQAYQMAAQWNAVLLNEKRLTSDDQIRSRMQEQRKLLSSAQKTFKEIRDGINASKDWALLTPTQQRVLRNSYFAEADLMFQSKDYDGALAAYRNIANRLLNEPEALEALTQAAECLKQLGRTDESMRVVAQARDVLEQIPSQRDAQFGSFTRFSRSEWSKHLDWMSKNSL